ncbi:uncharacterized protein LOC133800230 [Humulus lupulus]|uniref:uncharacterized protein LOC133800230 n=1 Tax=Humulus lupulus TaxID=3486 RepID=UPI002B410EF0|nr:uncharacterized protein LOC133800230 [Humulus lupulus]
MKSDPPHLPWSLFVVYGPPSFNVRDVFWSTLEDLVMKENKSVLVMGDLNGTLKDSECIIYSKPGNTSYYSFDLRRMVAWSGLIDIGALGLSFTWRKNCKKSNGLSSLKRARLDRCIALADWRVHFHKAIVTNIPTMSSDHNSIFLDTSGNHGRPRKKFMYENM